MEEMVTDHHEQAHQRTIKKIEVDCKISRKALHQWKMDWMFGDESNSDSCTEGGDRIQENTSDLDEKDTSATRSEGWGNHFSIDKLSWKCGFFIVLNQKGGTKCSTYEI